MRVILNFAGCMGLCARFFVFLFSALPGMRSILAPRIERAARTPGDCYIHDEKEQPRGLGLGRMTKGSATDVLHVKAKGVMRTSA